VILVFALVICLWPSADCQRTPATCGPVTAGSSAELVKQHDAYRARLVQNVKEQSDNAKALGEAEREVLGETAAVALAKQHSEQLAKSGVATPVEQQAAGRSQQQRETALERANEKLLKARAQVDTLAKAQADLSTQLTELERKISTASPAARWVGSGISYDLRVLILMFLVGAIGGGLHAISSWVSFWGGQQLRMSWLPWTLLRPITGGMLGVLLYLTLRGGLLSPASGDVTVEQPINLYGFSALCGLAGLFTSEAMERLKKLLGGNLGQQSGAAAPTIANVSPQTFTLAAAQAANGQAITVTGSGFTSQCKVTVAQGAGFGISNVKVTAPAKIEFVIKAAAAAAAGTVRVAIEDEKTKKKDETDLKVS
jgi:hypothetical protein